jgi:hypothetical protein
VHLGHFAGAEHLGQTLEADLIVRKRRNNLPARGKASALRKCLAMHTHAECKHNIHILEGTNHRM